MRSRFTDSRDVLSIAVAAILAAACGSPSDGSWGLNTNGYSSGGTSGGSSSGGPTPGEFSVKRRDARIGRNPRTGAHVEVDEKVVPFFKTGKEMRERLNDGYTG